MSAHNKLVGRYAPSPTGRLHLGNLRTGLISWLHARLNRGRFLLRMEDVDTPRVVMGSDLQILNDLEWLGLDWDGEVLYQSSRGDRYHDVLADLAKHGLTYPCFCSRKDIQLASRDKQSVLGIYPGTCAKLDAREAQGRMRDRQWSIRCRAPLSPSIDYGDFVVRRADKVYAYQLAVVVDDIDQGVTHVVRGEDLANCTDRQRYLAAQISRDKVQIEYHHVPLMLDSDGNKMSKRDGSYSAQQWRDEGKQAEILVGELAYSLGLVDQACSLSAVELLEAVSINKLNSLFNE